MCSNYLFEWVSNKLHVIPLQDIASVKEKLPRLWKLRHFHPRLVACETKVYKDAPTAEKPWTTQSNRQAGDLGFKSSSQAVESFVLILNMPYLKYRHYKSYELFRKCKKTYFQVLSVNFYY